MRVVKLEDGNIGRVITGQYDELKGIELFYPVGYGSYNEENLQQLKGLEFTEGSEQDYISYIEQEYHFGKVVKTHIIGEYQIIESVDSEEKTRFSPYINYGRIGQSFHSLEKAITGVICYKYDGANSQANDYLWKMIK